MEEVSGGEQSCCFYSEFSRKTSRRRQTKKREGRRDTGRVSRLKIKGRNKVPKRERTSEMLRENVLLCIREKREKKPQWCMKTKKKCGFSFAKADNRSHFS